MNEAIKKAIGGGWKPFGSIKTDGLGWSTPEVYANFYHQPTWLLDPLFWQAIGKAEGWQEANAFGFKPTPEGRKVWLEYWHDFIDHLADGKEVEEFFTDLIKKDK